MLQMLKNIFGLSHTDYTELLENGAQIIDVRTPQEYATGHINGSINIPLNVLPSTLNKVQKDKPIITCCASGMRSASARGLLISKGYKDVYNGGGWTSLQRKIKANER